MHHNSSGLPLTVLMMCDLQRITKAINKRVEMVSSARAIKAGDTFSVRDIKVSPQGPVSRSVKGQRMVVEEDGDEM